LRFGSADGLSAEVEVSGKWVDVVVMAAAPSSRGGVVSLDAMTQSSWFDVDPTGTRCGAECFDQKNPIRLLHGPRQSSGGR